MAWIKSEQALGQHPKLKLVANELGITIPQAIGHLHLFWWWAVDYAENGDITRYKDFVPFSAQWEGEPEDFTKALIKHGWIDENDGKLTIHDWVEYTGALIEIRQKDAERKRQSRQRANSKTSANKFAKSNGDTREWTSEAEIEQSPEKPIEYEVINLNKFDKNVSTGRPKDVHSPSDVDKTREDKTREDKIISNEVAVNEVGNELVLNDWEVIVEDMGQRHKQIFKTICIALGYDMNQLTSMARGQLNKAVKELNDIDVDLNDIPIRAKNHLLNFGFKATPTSLAKHWASLDKVSPRLSPNELSTLQQKMRTASELDNWANEK
jgi:hypothetical protein|tara:strand:+ start:3988 stop:4959 length:972 start_codon:yes stop_codon:yes gene_type:complete